MYRIEQNKTEHKIIAAYIIGQNLEENRTEQNGTKQNRTEYKHTVQNNTE